MRAAIPPVLLLLTASHCDTDDRSRAPTNPGGYQTDAPAPAATEKIRVETVASGLEHPWALEFMPDGRMLVTERPGRLRIVGIDGRLSAPALGVPEVMAEGQGGLLDVALAPDFAQSRRIYLSYAEPREGGSGTSVAAAILRDGDPPQLDDLQVIFRQLPTYSNSAHFGSRIVPTDDGMLYIGLGERFDEATRVRAQALDNHLGKVVRIRADGSVPSDNPFVGEAGALPEIWSYGHRNIQSAALHPTRRDLWIAEHGPMGGDELNLPAAGANHGWPVVSYGLHYSGEQVGSGEPTAPGIADPKYYWTPSIAPSGMVFYTGDVFPAWHGDLFVGALAERHLNRLDLDGDKIVGEEKLLTDLDERIRDVAQGPDGNLYVITDSDDGRILRLVPR
ncbi:MAG TPA: PQQ-dependent sugar dehydrogenase [Nannocystis sp.]